MKQDLEKYKVLLEAKPHNLIATSIRLVITRNIRGWRIADHLVRLYSLDRSGCFLLWIRNGEVVYYLPFDALRNAENCLLDILRLTWKSDFLKIIERNRHRDYEITFQWRVENL